MADKASESSMNGQKVKVRKVGMKWCVDVPVGFANRQIVESNASWREACDFAARWIRNGK